jgi:hypothetical protein
MMFRRLLIISGFLALCSTSASAFEQTQMGGSASANSSISSPQSLPSGVPGVELVTPQTQPAKPEGMKLRLPGIGVIGTLPKLDFGLELLYGSRQDKPIEEEPGLTDGGLTIHGSLKHRF